MVNSFELLEELAEMIKADEGLQSPDNPDEALELHKNLLDRLWYFAVIL